MFLVVDHLITKHKTHKKLRFYHVRETVGGNLTNFLLGSLFLQANVEHCVELVNKVAFLCHQQKHVHTDTTILSTLQSSTVYQQSEPSTFTSNKSNNCGVVSRARRCVTSAVIEKLLTASCKLVLKDSTCMHTYAQITTEYRHHIAIEFGQFTLAFTHES